jgi:hypothetical protein
MTFAEISDLSQALGLVAVIVSLIFVAYQIRQHTRALKANSHHAVTNSFNAMHALIINDKKVARVYRLGMEGSELLDEDERLSFSFMLLGYMRIFETIHYQYITGCLEPKLFEAELNSLKYVVTAPGFLAWWPANPITLSPEYFAFVSELIRTELAKAAHKASQ